MTKYLRFTMLMATMLCNGFGVAQTMEIDHGPYLQGVSTDQATFKFTTSAPAMACVEIKATDAAQTTRIYPLQNGLVKAGGKSFSITAHNLKPNTQYAYRIHAKHMKTYKPYKIVYGDSVQSEWHAFNTINPKQKEASFFITSDMHDRPNVLATLLEQCDYKTCDACFFVGDMLSYLQHKEATPYTSFIDTCTTLFASEIPFYWMRGNHETRGNLATTFSDYIVSESGKSYGTCQWGDIFFLMLDGGEDKADAHPVYGGLAKYDDFRSEEAAWLEQVIKSKAFKRAKYRIVLSHFPLLEHNNMNDWPGCKDAGDKFMPILNKAKIDLQISGHTHRLKFHEPNSKDNTYPVLEQGHKNATRINIKDGRIEVVVKDLKGETVFHKFIIP